MRARVFCALEILRAHDAGLYAHWQIQRLRDQLPTACLSSLEAFCLDRPKYPLISLILRTCLRLVFMRSREKLRLYFHASSGVKRARKSGLITANRITSTFRDS